MSKTGKGIATLEKMLPYLKALPDDVTYEVGEDCLLLYGDTQVQARACRNTIAKVAASPSQLVWRRVWHDMTKWWEYDITLDGVGIRIWAVHDAPACCHAITATRKVVKDVPVTFETREVEETVIVGWHCGDNGPDKAILETAEDGGDDADIQHRQA